MISVQLEHKTEVRVDKKGNKFGIEILIINSVRELSFRGTLRTEFQHT